MRRGPLLILGLLGPGQGRSGHLRQILFLFGFRLMLPGLFCYRSLMKQQCWPLQVKVFGAGKKGSEISD